MKIQKAIEIVLSLAKENVLRLDQCDDHVMTRDRSRQLEAIDLVEGLFDGSGKIVVVNGKRGAH